MSGGQAVRPVADDVDRLCRVVGGAVVTTPGVHALGTMPLLLGRASRIPGAQVARTPGLTMAVGQTRAFVGSALVAETGTPLPDLAGAVRDRVTTWVGAALGRRLRIDVDVIDVHTPIQNTSGDEDRPASTELLRQPGAAADDDAASTPPL